MFKHLVELRKFKPAYCPGGGRCPGRKELPYGWVCGLRQQTPEQMRESQYDYSGYGGGSGPSPGGVGCLLFVAVIAVFTIVMFLLYLFS